MKISQQGIDLIKQFEGCRLAAYPDPATQADPWTIGYGHTGQEVVEGLTITAEEADAYLKEDLEKFEQCVGDALVTDVTQGQFDALVAFAFNVGCRAMSGSTLLQMTNAGQREAAAAQFARWNKANGKVMAGLTNRRQAERRLYMT